jgi:RNA polymerase sigma factor (sigma-70 family)
LAEQIAADMNDTDDPCEITPLTRNGYRRSPSTESDILILGARDDSKLRAAFLELDEQQPGYHSAEALVYFIRDAHRTGQGRRRDALVGLLVQRCQRYFRGAVKGFDPETRQDIQNDVISDMIRLLIDPSDVADFLEVRFWKYLQRKTVTMTGRARRVRFRAPLFADVSESENDGPLLSVQQSEQAFAEEDRAKIVEVLSLLPDDLRELVILRYFEDWPIGNERRTTPGTGQPTLAERFGCTPRTIHNHLVKAREIMKSHWKDEQ